MKKSILFVCKHNVFRSRVAEVIFNRINKNKNYKASSAGIFKWDKKDLKGNVGYQIEKEAAKEFGLEIPLKSRNISSSLMGETDILVIVADDVPPHLFKNSAFNGKIIVLSVRDLFPKDTNKEKVARDAIMNIEKKVKDLVRKLK